MTTQTHQITISAYLATPKANRPPVVYQGQAVTRIVGSFRKGEYLIITPKIRFTGKALDTLLDVQPEAQQIMTQPQTQTAQAAEYFSQLDPVQRDNFLLLLKWQATGENDGAPAAEYAENDGAQDGNMFGAPVWDGEEMAEHFSAAWHIVARLIRNAILLPRSTNDLHACFTAVEIIAKAMNQHEWEAVE